MATSRATGKDTLTISGSYDLDHLDYVFTNPERVFRVSHFFIDHWLPLLGPALAWLVVAMQQACWRNGTRHPNGRISQRQLGQLCGLKRETVNRHLNNPDNLIQWFISSVDPVHNQDGGRTSNRYHVFLNDPLTPQAIRGLQALLAPDQPDSDTLIEQTVQALLAMDQAELLPMLLAQASDSPLPTQPLTVRTLISQTLHTDEQALNKKSITLATRLSRRILRPDQVYIGTQYFREQWVASLGATRAWLVTVLRRHCYENKIDQEIRDEFTFDKKMLAAKLGVSTKTLQRALADLSPLQPFFSNITVSHHQIEGRVLVNDEPLTAADLERKNAAERALALHKNQAEAIRGIYLLRNKSVELVPVSDGSGQNITGEVESNGQKVTGTPETSGQNITGVNDQTRQNITGTELANETKYHREEKENGQKRIGDQSSSRHNVTRSDLQSRQNITDSKHLILSTHQDSAQEITDDEIYDLLDQLDIRPPTRNDLAQLPFVKQKGALAAWAAWYTMQNTFGPGWVVQQLRAGLWPPETDIYDRSGRLAQDNSPLLNTSEPPTLSAIEQRWQETLEALGHQMTKSTFDSWLKETKVKQHTDGVLTIQVKNEQAKAWLEHRLKAIVARTAARIWGENLTVSFEVEEDDEYRTPH